MIAGGSVVPPGDKRITHRALVLGPLAARRSLGPLDYESPTASAQVKGALMFAGLAAGVPVSIREPVRSRDHSERMLRALGATVHSEGLVVRFTPPASIPAFDMVVPADPSSA